VATPTGLYGSFDLTARTIDAVIAVVTPGAYALGTSSILDRTHLEILYIGRSDDDVRARLKRHVGEYSHFQYVLLPSALSAFEKECWLYHTFSPRDNILHPARPQNVRCDCPVPGCTALFY